MPKGLLKTPARQCIHEILVEFGRLELHMSQFHDWSGGHCVGHAGARHFEEMAQTHPPRTGRTLPPRACGTTASAFANLFLSRAQIQIGQSFDIVSGGLFTRLSRIPNFSWTAIATAAGLRADDDDLLQWLGIEDYHRGQSTAAVPSLCNELVEDGRRGREGSCV